MIAWTSSWGIGPRPCWKTCKTQLRGEGIALLPAKRRKLVDGFLALKELPEPLGQEFIQAMQEVLSGLAKVVLKMDDLKAALLEGGTPATPAEIKRRVEEFVNTLIKGKDASKVRIVLE